MSACCFGNVPERGQGLTSLSLRLGPSTCSGSLRSTPKEPRPWPVLSPPCQKEILGAGSVQAHSGQGFPHINPTLGPFLAHFLDGGGWSLAPHGDLSLVLLPAGGSGHHQGLFGVLKSNLGTMATWHGVWLKGVNRCCEGLSSLLSLHGVSLGCLSVCPSGPPVGSTAP